jgi:hypothetical protein
VRDYQSISSQFTPHFFYELHTTAILKIMLALFICEFVLNAERIFKKIDKSKDEKLSFSEAVSPLAAGIQVCKNLNPRPYHKSRMNRVVHDYASRTTRPGTFLGEVRGGVSLFYSNDNWLFFILSIQFHNN